jgi:hypothetical protein
MDALGVSLEETDSFRQRRALIAAAHAGDARAQFLLGERYRIGDEFTERDCGEAFKWYGLAAEQGDPDAQNNLGSMHLNGMGVPKDAAKAVAWYRKAAKQGLPVAQFNLGLLRLHGEGVEQDDDLAAVCLMMAAKQGHVQAMAQLGTLCRFGRGVERDIVMAAQLHVLAAEAGDPTSLGNLCDYQEELEQIALGGNASASVSLATIFDRGLGVAQDQPKALAWIRWARAQGTPEVDENVRLELEKLEFESVLMATADVELRAEALLAEMRRSCGAVRPT